MYFSLKKENTQMAENSRKNEFFERESIAIIAILAGMLLPSLNKARERARITQCMNNCKSMTQIIYFYSDDFNGFAPGTAYGNFGSGNKTWMAHLTASGHVKNTVQPYMKCPALPKDYHNDFAYGFTMAMAFTAEAWEKKPALRGEKSIWRMAYSNAYVYMDSISSPSSTLMLGDGGPKENGGGSNWYKFPLNEKARDLPYQLRHNNGLNGAFWDGHAEWMAKNKVNWFEASPFYFNSLKFPWY